MTQCCKTCRFLDVPLDKAGRRVVRIHDAFPCTAPLPEMPALPDSITKVYGYKPAGEGRKCWMHGDMGTTCPVWEAMG